MLLHITTTITVMASPTTICQKYKFFCWLILLHITTHLPACCQVKIYLRHHLMLVGPAQYQIHAMLHKYVFFTVYKSEISNTDGEGL